MFIVIYLVVSIFAIFLRFLSYKLGNESTSTNYEKRYRLVKWFGYLTIIYFIVMIPVFDDGSVLMMMVNVLNIVLSGVVSYGYILNFIGGVHNKEERDFNNN